MSRMIDPSELEGDELAIWYGRSPAEVEAEREAVRRDRYERFVRSVRASSEISDAGPGERGDGQLEDSLDEGDTGFINARFLQPPAQPIRPPPSGLRVGPVIDAQGGPPAGAGGAGFFGEHDYSSSLGGYFTDLPAPLNIVTSTPSGWWELGDGDRVRTGEVERIYAEQQRQLKGQDGGEPAVRVRVVDRWRDGEVPLERQVAAGERELDPTCAPNGGWERDPNFRGYSERAKRYETQVTRAPGLDYVVRNPGQRPVKFDGCAVWDPRRPLLEAKGPGYAALLPRSLEWGFFGNMLRGAVDQADRQREAAPKQRIEWHVAEPGAVEFFDGVTAPMRPPIVLQQTPAR